MTDEQLKQYRDASNRLMDPDCGEMEAMNLAMWLGERAHIMLDQIEELIAENDRLLGVIADPQLLGVKIDERCIEVSAQPREEIMRHLFVMMAHALGDSPNFVECTFGPDPKSGKSYVLELRHYHGKTPGQVHDEQVKQYRAACKAIVEAGGSPADVFGERFNLALDMAKAAMANRK